MTEPTGSTRMPATGPSRLDLWASATAWLADGRAIAIATVIDTWGSSPVPVGGQMIVLDEATFAGSVSGGCVEAEVIVAALDVIESGEAQRLSFGVADQTAWAAGLPCGGRIEIHVARWHGPDDTAIGREIENARAGRKAVLLATDLADGRRKLFGPDAGAAIPEAFAGRIASGRSGRLESAAPFSEGEVFAHVLRPNPRLLVVGATHIAQALVEILRPLGMALTIIDPRESFASQSRFATTSTRHEWPGEAFAQLGLDAYTAVAVVAHVEHIDDEALVAALASPAPYVGALGSRRNHEKRSRRLAAAGVSSRDIARIRCPIGIDIGAVTPEEIALAIAADVVLAFRGPKRAAAGSKRHDGSAMTEAP